MVCLNKGMTSCIKNENYHVCDKLEVTSNETIPINEISVWVLTMLISDECTLYLLVLSMFILSFCNQNDNIHPDEVSN